MRNEVIISLLLATIFNTSPSANAWSTSRSQTSGEVTRRSILSSAAGALVCVGSTQARAEEDFSSIAGRAAQMSKLIEKQEPPGKAIKPSSSSNIQDQSAPKSPVSTKTAYDFDLPVEDKALSFTDLIEQDEAREKVKAVLVVNIKQDDPVARKNIPEFITLASKYGRNGEFVVICSPTDQGYYEPDTSTLIRLKLASEYGYGINPSTKLTDKVNLLGSGAHPFWRWLEGTCRAPSGLGRVEGNFEKFLLDARTGMPLRRYPRKYMPLDIKDDIEAVLAGKSLPPAGANYLEEWRTAARDEERDTYRFQKGVNYFDQ